MDLVRPGDEKIRRHRIHVRNLGPKDPRIKFHETIKEIEQRVGDPAVLLQSFIVSNTPSTTMSMLCIHGSERFSTEAGRSEKQRFGASSHEPREKRRIAALRGDLGHRRFREVHLAEDQAP